MPEKILLKDIDNPRLRSLEGYRELQEGYVALKKALEEMTPEQVAEEVKTSNIRGRGGAGFPAGIKWSFVPRDTGKPIYLCCNADEGEPGTFKDRLLMHNCPHSTIEGIALASYALGVETAFIYIRGEMMQEAQILDEAIEEARQAGYLGKNILGKDFNLEIVVHRGAGAYICGEETALIESIEGKRGHPRLKPPFPAVIGCFGCPTVVNNVETLASCPWIIRHGGAAYKAIGTEKSSGTKLISASGHINKPGVYEIECGLPLMEFIESDEYCGGVREGHQLKACIPGGSSTPIMTAEECANANLDYESLMENGSMLGSGGFIVMDETADIVETTWCLSHFYAHESCGQCTPCREGTKWASKVLDKLMRGDGESSDIDLLVDIANGMDGTTICPMGPAAAWPIQSAIKKFRADFEARIK